MSKNAAKNTTTHAHKEVGSSESATNAKLLFVTSALDMGWQLAVAVLLPVLAGSFIDQRFGSSPIWTLLGLLIAVICSVAIVRKTIKNVNIKQSTVKDR